MDNVTAGLSDWCASTDYELLPLLDLHGDTAVDVMQKRTKKLINHLKGICPNFK